MPRLADIVILRYGSKTDFPETTDLIIGDVPDDLHVDLATGKWEFIPGAEGGGIAGEKVTKNIGESFIPMERASRKPKGIIGVYDRDDTHQLSALARAAAQATK